MAPLESTSNNGITGVWSPALDNTATTTYTFTPDAGQGNCVQNTTMVIEVSPPVTPMFDQIADICEGDLLPPLPTTATNGISGSWAPAINNNTTTTYTFTPDPGQCADTETMTITVNTISILSITATVVSDYFEANQIIEATASGGSGNYEFQLDGGIWQNSGRFEYVLGCEQHLIKVRDALGCSTEPTAEANILEYPKFFTPNNDGFNDTWNIDCLKQDPRAIISIFNRYGKLLKQIKASGQDWDGTFNGILMPNDDYWFHVEYWQNTELKTFRSHFSLKR